jgi:hypothetical protein
MGELGKPLESRTQGTQAACNIDQGGGAFDKVNEGTLKASVVIRGALHDGHPKGVAVRFGRYRAAQASLSTAKALP